MHAWHLCGNHQNALIEGSAIAFQGASNITFLSSLSSLFQFGSYWARTLEAVEIWVDANLRMMIGAPPSGAAAYVEELRAYCLYHYQRFAEAGAPGPEAPDLASDSAWGRAWDEFAKDLNGPLYLHGTSCFELQHFCRDKHCCNNFDRTTAVKRISQSIRKVIFAQRLKRPVCSKWTKLGPTVDWYVPFFCVGNMASELLRLAFGKISRKPLDDKVPDLDDTFIAWDKTRRYSS